MYVCVCHAVTDKTIAHAAAEGVTDFAQLVMCTGIATACGCCREEAVRCLTNSQPSTAATRAMFPVLGEFRLAQNATSS
jgi:bacterioferritin-associated ferredoxin